MSLNQLRALHAKLTGVMQLHSLAAAGLSAAATSIDPDELPLATCHVDETSGMLIVGLAVASAADGNRHLRIIRQLAQGVAVRLAYVDVVRDAVAAPPSSKKQDARPLLGGVRMNGDGTMSLVIRQDGEVAVIASSHVVGPDTGQDVGQAGRSSVYGKVTLNPSLTHRRSDSALTSITNRRIQGAPYAIWRSAGPSYRVTRFATSTETPIGTAVWMQGAQSAGLQSGVVVTTGVTVKDARGTLTNQVMASYFAQGGDSGAPVFLLSAADGEVAYAGIHAGRFVYNDDDERAFYSPWEGVRDDLALAPDLE